MITDNYFRGIYDNRSQKTIKEWMAVDNDSTAPSEINFYPEKLLALTSGIRPELNMSIKSLLSDLRSICRDDPRAEVISDKNFHLTFIAITPSVYASFDELPDISGITQLFRNRLKSFNIGIEDLQLVALPNQLLLAGIPDRHAVIIRQFFWEKLISSEWRGSLLERYPGTTLPPEFWHTTLLRYKSSQLSASLRDYFLSKRSARYGSINGELQLVLSPYDWNEPKILV